jgi:hypothetical protein
MWGALSDDRTGLSFTISSGSRQRSHSRVRVPRLHTGLKYLISVKSLRVKLSMLHRYEDLSAVVTKSSVSGMHRRVRPLNVNCCYGGDIFLQRVSWFSMVYTALYPRTQNSSVHYRENSMQILALSN